MLAWLRGRRKADKPSPTKTRLRTEALEPREVPSATLVKDVNRTTAPGVPAYSPGGFVQHGGAVYFAADDGEHGVELWRTDGTAAGTRLVRDLNPGAEGGLAIDPIAPGKAVSVGNWLYFVADDGTNGTGLWKTDGTEANTRLVKAIDPIDPYVGAIDNLTVVGATVYFSADDGDHGVELWKSDGTTAGTKMVKDINRQSSPWYLPGIPAIPMGSHPNQLTAFDGKLYFVADNGVRGSELWRSDGTAAGTVLLKDINTNPISPSSPFPQPAMNEGSSIAALTRVGGRLMFAADDGVRGREVWISDGTAAGTRILKDINPAGASSNVTDIVAINGVAYFAAQNRLHGSELWRSDGTVGGTWMVKDIHVPNPAAMVYWSPGSNIQELTAVDGALFFTADDGIHGQELWRSDGTRVGTRMVADLPDPPTTPYPLPLASQTATSIVPPWMGFGSRPNQLTEVGGQLAFVVGDDLWRSNGTAVGTTKVKDFEPASYAGPMSLTEFRNQLLFAADDGEHGPELWKSDGSTAGTAMVADLNPDTQPSIGYFDSVEVGGVVYYAADDGEHGVELWRSDGTYDGTWMVRDLNPTAPDEPYYRRSANPGQFAVVGGAVFFVADDGEHGSELWRTDGTSAGTRLVRDLNPAGSDMWPPIYYGAGMPIWYQGANIGNLTKVGNALYFTADDGEHGQELWKTDGTEAGTVLVKDIRSVSDYGGGSYPGYLTDVNGTLYFFADDGSHGIELWKTDGTTGGTVLVKDINLIGGSNPTSVVAVGNALFFAADDGVRGLELWKTDGTAAGTVLVKDINTSPSIAVVGGAAGSNIRELTRVGGVVYFVADDGERGPELWKSDGTAGGTVLVKAINPSTDTWQVGPPTPSHLTAVGNVLYFVADDGVNGLEPWKTNGTAAGTTMVRDINTGGSSFPSSLVVWDGKLYFVADDGVHGAELWTSDGTMAGTQLVEDANPGAASGMMTTPWSVESDAIQPAGDKLIFATDDGEHGTELHVIERTTSPGNRPPVASAGGPYTVREGALLKLDASRSSDPDGDKLSYSWDVNGDGTFGDATGATPTLTAGLLRALGLRGGSRYSVRVRVDDGHGHAAESTAALDVQDAALRMEGMSFEVVEGSNFNRNVAAFSDPGGPEEVRHYRASIDWGDGTSSVGTVAAVGAAFRVAGAHAYAKFGTYTVRVCATDDGGPPVEVTATATVKDASLYGTRMALRATAGRAFDGAVASFTDMNPFGRAADYLADIVWGDGATTRGTVRANGRGGFDVVGAHTFARPGTFAVRVRITDGGTSEALVDSPMTVNPVRLAGRGYSNRAVVGTTFDGAVMTFRDEDPSAVAGLYTATIEWGDGRTSAGRIEADGQGGFNVRGGNRYTSAGGFAVRATVRDALGNSVVAVGRMQVS